jgi:hypothetical protein
MANRKAADYLNVGQLVSIPESIPAPVVYSADCPNGKTVRVGKVVERMVSGGVAVDLQGKVWDYSNKEALQFSKVY